MRSPLPFLAGAVAALAACGCRPKDAAAPAPAPAPPTPGAKDAPGAGASKAAAILKDAGRYEVVEVKDGGSLEVTALFTGDPIPESTEVPVNIDVPVCGHKVFTENVLVDKTTRGLKNVVVRLEGIARGKAPPQKITVKNENCAFVPHVGVAVKGTLIEIQNADPVLHTTHPYIAGTSFFNLPLQPKEEPPQPRPIPRTGLMEVTCDVHKWMRGYVYVHSNPYLEVSDKAGKLRIDAIPPGKYSYVAWHEAFPGEKKGEVEIAAGKTAQLKLEYTTPK
jgi:hypothetical protein